MIEVFTIPVATTEDQTQYLIDIGPFFDRFGSAKMQVLTSSDLGVQAIIKDTQVRKWLDLRLPEIAQSVEYVASKVPAVTEEGCRVGEVCREVVGRCDEGSGRRSRCVSYSTVEEV
jgi:hypothetical protein